jgi:hypothetical protein
VHFGISDELDDHGCSQENQKRYDHGATRVTMADVALRAGKHEIPEITDCSYRIGHEVRKPRMTRPDKSPADAGQGKNADDIACPDVNRRDVFRQVCDEECKGNGPVRY